MRYEKIYEPTEWKNDSEPSLSEDNLNNIERGINGLDNRIVEIGKFMDDTEVAQEEAQTDIEKIQFDLEGGGLTAAPAFEWRINVNALYIETNVVMSENSLQITVPSIKGHFVYIWIYGPEANPEYTGESESVLWDEMISNENSEETNVFIINSNRKVGIRIRRDDGIQWDEDSLNAYVNAVEIIGEPVKGLKTKVSDINATVKTLQEQLKKLELNGGGGGVSFVDGNEVAY